MAECPDCGGSGYIADGRGSAEFCGCNGVYDLMPCGHPRGCIIASPYIADVASSVSCGWCASIAAAEAARSGLS
jgi:hypothetical protein